MFRESRNIMQGKSIVGCIFGTIENPISRAGCCWAMTIKRSNAEILDCCLVENTLESLWGCPCRTFLHLHTHTHTQHRAHVHKHMTAVAVLPSARLKSNHVFNKLLAGNCFVKPKCCMRRVQFYLVRYWPFRRIDDHFGAQTQKSKEWFSSFSWLHSISDQLNTFDMNAMVNHRSDHQLVFKNLLI